MRISPVARLVVCCVVAVAGACGEPRRAPTTPSPGGSAPPLAANDPAPGPSSPPQAPRGQTATVIAAGDIGWCDPPGARTRAPAPAVAQTARLIEGLDGQVILAGDLAYLHGTPEDFIRCFEPSWGQFRRRWRPVPGNHEYETPNAAGYFQYFGEAAGSGGRSYYSFRAGDWLVLMLNSNIPAGAGSEQFQFVRSELQSRASLCTMAVWHHPLFSSGPNGPNAFMRDMWGLLHEGGADVVVAAHDHLYERFGKQNVDAVSDAGGIRQFIVGTGGANLYAFQGKARNSQVQVSAHGVLRLTLHSTNYEWAFLQVDGTLGDTGADNCH